MKTWYKRSSTILQCAYQAGSEWCVAIVGCDMMFRPDDLLNLAVHDPT